jgi:hypothetical protein
MADFRRHFEGRSRPVVFLKLTSLALNLAPLVLVVRDWVDKTMGTAAGLRHSGLLAMTAGLAGLVFVVDDFLRGETSYTYTRKNWLFGSRRVDVTIDEKRSPVSFWFHCLVQVVFCGALLVIGWLLWTDRFPGAVGLQPDPLPLP